MQRLDRKEYKRMNKLWLKIFEIQYIFVKQNNISIIINRCHKPISGLTLSLINCSL